MYVKMLSVVYPGATISLYCFPSDLATHRKVIARNDLYCVFTSPSLSTETCEFESKAETLSSAMSALQTMNTSSLAKGAYEHANRGQRSGNHT